MLSLLRVDFLGQLGLGHTANVKKVSEIKCLRSTDEQVQLAACGRESSIVATSSGSLYSFGSNSHGQLGLELDESTAIHSSPERISSFRSNVSWRQIAMGAEHTCALTEDGTVYIWGGQCVYALKYDQITRPNELRIDYSVATM